MIDWVIRAEGVSSPGRARMHPSPARRIVVVLITKRYFALEAQNPQQTPEWKTPLPTA